MNTVVLLWIASIVGALAFFGCGVLVARLLPGWAGHLAPEPPEPPEPPAAEPPATTRGPVEERLSATMAALTRADEKATAVLADEAGLAVAARGRLTDVDVLAALSAAAADLLGRVAGTGGQGAARLGAARGVDIRVEDGVLQVRRFRAGTRDYAVSVVRANPLAETAFDAVLPALASHLDRYGAAYRP